MRYIFSKLIFPKFIHMHRFTNEAYLEIAQQQKVAQFWKNEFTKNVAHYLDSLFIF